MEMIVPLHRIRYVVLLHGVNGHRVVHHVMKVFE